MPEEKKPAQGSVFISYSRKDKEFIQKLNAALDNAGVQAWVDWEGIELATDWRDEIDKAIRTHNTFIFVISPDSLDSKVCGEELDLGIKYNKKLIPVLYRPANKGQKMHQRLAATNWVYLRQEDDFDATIPRLVESIRTDLDWVNRSTQILGQAMEWEGKGKNKSFLLQGTELEDAEKWMASASVAENRPVLPLQVDFITTSRGEVQNRQRTLLIGVSLALVVSIALSIIAIIARYDAVAAKNDAIGARNEALVAQKRAEKSEADAIEAQKRAEASEAVAKEKEAEAVEQSIRANASRGVAEAQNLQTEAGQLDSSTLVAIETYQLQLENNIPETEQAEDIIRSNSSLMAVPVAQMQQDGFISNIEWSPDQKFFVTGNGHDPSDENAVNQACVYRAEDGAVEYCVIHDHDVNDAVFTQDGQYLVTASTDKTVRFWDAANGSPLNDMTLTFEGAALDLDVNDEVVAIGREDNFLTLFYLNKPDLDPVHKEQADGVSSVEFSPSGELLAFGLQNGQTRFWQARNIFYYNGPKHDPSSYAVLAWSPDNLWLASGGGDSYAKITKRDGSFKYNVTHQDWVEDVAFGPDPAWFATASDDNIIRVLNTTDGTEKFRMAHTDFAQDVIVSPDGEWIASTGYDQVVRIWDAVSGTQLLEIPLEANGSALSFNDDASRLIVADEGGTVGVWDVSALKSRTNYIAFPEFVQQAEFTPSGEYLIVNSDDFKVWRIPADQIDQIREGTQGTTIYTADSLTYSTAVSPDSKWVVVAETDSEDAQKNRGTLVSINGGTQYPLDHGGEVSGVAFTSDSSLAATAGNNGFVKFWDVRTGNQTDTTLDNSEPVVSLAISPGAPVVAAGLNGKTRLWDSSNGKTLQDLPQAGDIISASFNADGSLLATGSSDGTVIIWKAEGNSFESLGRTIELQQNEFINSFSFSPDSQALSGGGSNGTVYIWNVETGEENGRISLGSAPVTSVAYSTDGGQLLTVSRKVVRVWDPALIPAVSTSDLVQDACSHLTSNLSADEWNKYFSGTEYSLTCPDLPEKQ